MLKDWEMYMKDGLALGYCPGLTLDEVQDGVANVVENLRRYDIDVSEVRPYPARHLVNELLVTIHESLTEAEIATAAEVFFDAFSQRFQIKVVDLLSRQLYLRTL